MIICSCRTVSDREVESAIAQGASSVEAVGQLCGAGTDCGSCLDDLGERVARSCGRSCSAAEQAACGRGNLLDLHVLSAADNDHRGHRPSRSANAA